MAESTDKKTQTRLKAQYLGKAISEYEYSPEPEYKKSQMSSRAAEQGTVDFDYKNAESNVEICGDGAWVNARVWVPKEWLHTQRVLRKREKSAAK